MKPLKLFRRAAFLWLFSSALLTFNADAQNCVSRTFTENIEPIRLDFNIGAHLKITDRAGIVRISSWPSNENTILIRAKKKVTISTCSPYVESPEIFLSQLDVEVSGDANEVTVNSIFPESTPSGVSPLSLNYNIKIPNKASLDILNKLGAINISGIGGSMDLDLLAGKIKVLHPARPEPADTIDLRNNSGLITLKLPTRSAFDINALITVGFINVENLPVTVNSSLVGARINDSVNGGGTDVMIYLGAGVIKLFGLPGIGEM
jgi:hypothetical protein